jgi:hypothetical protein
MAAKKDDKPKVPQHITDYTTRMEQAELLLDTMELHHSKAYLVAADKHLRKDGKIKYDLMKDAKVRKDVVDEMMDYYKKTAKEAFKTQTKDFHEEELLTRAYHNITRSQLQQYTEQFKSDFTLRTFTGKIMPQMRQAQEQALTSAASAHIQSDHIDDIVKYVGASDVLHKDRLQRDDAISLLEAHRRSGSLPKNLGQIIADYAIKDAKYK